MNLGLLIVPSALFQVGGANFRIKGRGKVGHFSRSKNLIGERGCGVASSGDAHSGNSRGTLGAEFQEISNTTQSSGDGDDKNKVNNARKNFEREGRGEQMLPKVVLKYFAFGNAVCHNRWGSGGKAPSRWENFSFFLAKITVIFD